MNTIIQRQYRARDGWDNANKSLLNYTNYIKNKNKKFDLTIIDLFYISNFKGGNATIIGDEKEINKRLKHYSSMLREIDSYFGTKELKDLIDTELKELEFYVERILELCKKEDTGISGFKASYLSALLHSYFPNLIPILDRWVLKNLNVPHDIQENGQVKEIEKHFIPLIREVKAITQHTGKTLREIDREYFIIRT